MSKPNVISIYGRCALEWNGRDSELLTNKEARRLAAELIVAAAYNEPIERRAAELLRTTKPLELRTIVLPQKAPAGKA